MNFGQERNSGSLIKTACGLCPMACGMDVEVKGGKIIKVKGMVEHPVNKGNLCPKGASAVEYVYSPHRLKYPLKKDNGNWKQITWEEALGIIASRLTEVKETYGARSTAVYQGMVFALSGTPTAALLGRFLDVYGSPNCFSVESHCFRIRWVAYLLTYGKIPAQPFDEAENHSNCIMLWGHDPRATYVPLVKRLISAQKRGAKLIVIDPRRTFFAKRADIYTQIRPGTDCALALGILNTIISEELYDKEFVEKWTVGFDKLVDHVKTYPPEKIEKITGVPAETIKEIARTYALNKPACIHQGINSLDLHPSGFQYQRSISILQAITGNLDMPGGAVTPSMGGTFMSPLFMDLSPIRLPERLKEKPLGADKYPLFYGVWGLPFAEGQLMVLPDVILTGKPYPIKAMIVTGSNPVLTWPNSKKAKSALEKLDFLVVMTRTMTETAKLADIVLPVGTYLERTDLFDYYGAFGIPYVMMRKRVIDYYECWPDIKIWLELAKKMGYGKDFPWRTPEEFIDYTLKPTGLSVKHLMEENPAGVPYGSLEYRQYEREGFRTPSGKVELYSKTLEEVGYSPLPVYKEPLESPISTPELAREYPLILTTGIRILQYSHSSLREISPFHKRVPEPLAEIHPETAQKYGVTDNERVIVETRIGSIEIKVKLTEDIMAQVISIPHGWAQANVNLLTSEQSCDPVSGYPALRSLLCRIRKRDLYK